MNSNNVPTTINNSNTSNSINNNNNNVSSNNNQTAKTPMSKNSRVKNEPVVSESAKTANGNHQQLNGGGNISQQPLPKSATTNGNSNSIHDVHNNTFTTNNIANSQNQNNPNTTTNIKRDVVHKIQQSLDLFKNTNEKKLSWAKRLESKYSLFIYFIYIFCI